jgi:hypothetical protein
MCQGIKRRQAKFCQALDSDGKKCQCQVGVKSYQYHGENELYGYLSGENKPSWVKVYLCKKHAL